MNRQIWESAINLVISLGERVLSWRNDPSAMKVLSKAGMKTEADIRAHSFLHTGLSSLSMDFPIISEEDALHNDIRPESYWIIDPIDGTSSWYEGFPGFVSQVAFISNSQPIFGVVHAPVLKKTWHSFLGNGAWLNRKRLPLLKKGSQRFILIDNYPSPKRAALKVSQAMALDGYLESGSIGLKSVLVADGTADLFVKDIVVRDWDIAPAWPILCEVGAFVCLPDGKSYDFSGSFEKVQGILVARDYALAKKVIFILRKPNDRPEEGNHLDE